jgi:hypothetical protein
MIAKPIYWSAKDTDETIRQVKAHNAVYKAECLANESIDVLTKPGIC